MNKIRNVVRLIIITFRYWILTELYGMKISRSARVSWGTKLDKTYPKGIHIGEESYLASGAIVFSHEFLPVDFIVIRI